MRIHDMEKRKSMESFLNLKQENLLPVCNAYIQYDTYVLIVWYDTCFIKNKIVHYCRDGSLVTYSVWIISRSISSNHISCENILAE